MLDHTTNPTVRKPRDVHLRALSAVGIKVCRADDYRTREHGQQIIPRPGCLCRTYRNLPPGSLVSCMTRTGRGFKPARTTCSRYGGSGLLVLGQARPDRRW